MNRDERLKQNRQKYWANFGLGFGRGKGLFSILLLAAYSLFRRNGSKKHSSISSKDGKGPEQFETLYESSKEE